MTKKPTFPAEASAFEVTRERGNTYLMKDRERATGLAAKGYPVRALGYLDKEGAIDRTEAIAEALYEAWVHGALAFNQCFKPYTFEEFKEVAKDGAHPERKPRPEQFYKTAAALQTGRLDPVGDPHDDPTYIQPPPG